MSKSGIPAIVAIHKAAHGQGGGKQPPLGSGGRFAAIEAKAAASGAKNPAAVAASIGIKKYGQKRMTAMAQAGKKKHG